MMSKSPLALAVALSLAACAAVPPPSSRPALQTRPSRGVRLVTFGQDNQNVVQLLSIAQKLNDFKVVPQYDIRGSITQFDEDVDRRQGSVGVSLVSLFGVRASNSRQSSVLGFDA